MIKLAHNNPVIQQMPEPNQEQLINSQMLTAEIIANIQNNSNWISFKDFMNLALYHPTYGYYTSGSRKIGIGGDFITAPELGPLFAYGVARQLQGIIKQNPEFAILEFGAGSGQFAYDLLLELNKLDSLPKNYYILDISPELVDRQKKLTSQLPSHLKDKISWLSTLPTDNSFHGIIIANEVIDAMPVDVFRYNNNQVLELGLSLVNNNITWQINDCDITLNNYIEQNILPIILANSCQNIPKDRIEYTSEVNLLAINWLYSLTQCLAEGLIMLIDYGFPRNEYYHQDRKQGTIMCHYQHFCHQDPLLYLGLQDITAHVDFTSLAETAYLNSLDVVSFTSQAHFLLLNNITDYFNHPENVKDKNVFLLKQQLKKLTSPSEMGELFKFLLLSKNLDYTFFEHLEPYDRRDSL